MIRKVVYVIDDLGLGGAQRQLAALVKTLPRERFAVEIISLSTEKVAFEEILRKAGIPVTLISHSGKWSWSTLAGVYRKLREAKPDIVHTWLFTADLYGRLAAFLARTPHVISAMRNTIDDMPPHYRWVNRILSFVTDSITINAEAIRRGLARELGIPNRKIRTIYNGIDLSGFPPIHPNGHYLQEWDIPGNASVVLMIARMVPQKDHRTFLKAARRVAEKRQDVYFLLAGEGYLRGQVEIWIEEMGLRERTRLLGTRLDVWELIHQADVVALATHFEGCSNVVMEAMALGKPVVATQVGGNPELIVHGETGWTVPVKDDEAFAEALLNLLENETEARGMGEKGRRRIAEKFSLQKTTQEIMSLYDELLSRKKKGSAVFQAMAWDYARAYAQSSYQGKIRKTLHTWTSPGFQAVFGFRLTQWLLEKRISLLGALLQRGVEVWTGVSIPPETKIGPGLLVLHFGGIVINSQAVIGEECTLHHGVTIGNRRSGGPSPKIGNRVLVGAGAKILGGITVGDDVEIGANAVVLESLPDRAVAVGIPARVVKVKEKS